MAGKSFPICQYTPVSLADGASEVGFLEAGYVTLAEAGRHIREGGLLSMEVNPHHLVTMTGLLLRGGRSQSGRSW